MIEVCRLKVSIETELENKFWIIINQILAMSGYLDVLIDRPIER